MIQIQFYMSFYVNKESKVRCLPDLWVYMKDSLLFLRPLNVCMSPCKSQMNGPSVANTEVVFVVLVPS